MSASPTTIYEATGNGVHFAVLMFAGQQPRFEVHRDGQLADTIPATRSWRTEQRQAVNAVKQALGLPLDEEKPVVQVVVRGPQLVSGSRIAAMATLYADVQQEMGWSGTPEALLAEGRAHAERWAALGREPFDHEMQRLRVERCEQEESWEQDEREKEVYY